MLIRQALILKCEFSQRVCLRRPQPLCDDLTTLVGDMRESLKEFSGFITELKMEHKNGELKSERLTALLVYII